MLEFPAEMAAQKGNTLITQPVLQLKNTTFNQMLTVW